VRSCWGTEDRRRRTVEQGFSLCSLGVGKRPFVKAGPNRTPPRCSEAPFCEGRPGHSAPLGLNRSEPKVAFCLAGRGPGAWAKGALGQASVVPPRALLPGVTLSSPPVPLRSRGRGTTGGFPRERRGLWGAEWLRPGPRPDDILLAFFAMMMGRSAMLRSSTHRRLDHRGTLDTHWPAWPTAGSSGHP
jgi:hypothetical protein